MKKLPSRSVMEAAFRGRDTTFDGIFIVGVRTTGVFCRPVCRAKPPLMRNVEFFGTAKAALHHGYRPCKLCRPLDGGALMPEMVGRLMKYVEAHPAERVRERDLRAMGLDPSTVRRQFLRYCKMTFAAYQRARRMGRAMVEIRRGASVTRAQVGAGFASGSGFREAREKLFGMLGARNEAAMLWARWLTTPLGAMLAVAAEEGIVLVDFVDRKGLERAIERVRRRFGQYGRGAGAEAVIVPGEHRHLRQLAREMEEYFAGSRRSFDVTVAVRGTEFEIKAWAYLRTIPPGQTRSYGEQAAAMGMPRAVRAVGRANGINYLSIVIPCHRVIGADGKLTGYGGGLARKQWLLEHEKGMVGAGD